MVNLKDLKDYISKTTKSDPQIVLDDVKVWDRIWDDAFAKSVDHLLAVQQAAMAKQLKPLMSQPLPAPVPPGLNATMKQYVGQMHQQVAQQQMNQARLVATQIKAEAELALHKLAMAFEARGGIRPDAKLLAVAIVGALCCRAISEGVDHDEFTMHVTDIVANSQW